MLAEVIAIGDELTSGQRLDTNSQWLSQQLGDLGLRTMYHSTVGDDLTANIRVFREAAQRADIVITTGGLGPTADDLTRQAIADAFDAPLWLDPESLKRIAALFRSRGREMPERNRVQAEFPQGATVIENPQGSAPGFIFTVQRPTGPCSIITLPGVPAEMKEMWFHSVRDWLIERLGSSRRLICHKTLHCFGAGESDVEQRLPDMIRRDRTPTVGITASQATITLRISAQGADEQECQALIDPTAEEIRQILGDLVFGEDGVTLSQVVIDQLKSRSQTLVVADAATAGLVSQWLGNDDQPPNVFQGGTIVRGWEQLDSLPPEAGSVQPQEIVQRLGRELREQFSADWGLALLRVSEAPPNPDTLWVAVCHSQGAVTSRHSFAGHSAIVLPRAAKQGLNALRLVLQQPAIA